MSKIEKTAFELTTLPVTPILPKDGGADRPLWIVMSIMAFMASLALLLTSMSNRSSSDWQNQLKQSATVQVYLGETETREDITKAAMRIISSQGNISAKTLSEAESKQLIQPWIGDVDLPEDLPLPLMIAVDYEGQNTLDVESLAAALKEAGLDAEVDDHSTWSTRIRRAARAVRIGTSLILILLLAGSIAAAGFATQAAMAVHSRVVRVLTQVGAQDRFIAQLFVKRFFIIGAKAGAVGILGAFIFTFFIALLFGGRSDSSLLPGLHFSGSDLIYVLLIPVLFGVVSAIAAGLTSLQSLKADRRAV